MLLLAKEMGYLNVGVVGVDGTKIQANASKRRSIRYDRALELRDELRAEVKELLEKAEAADRADEPDDRTIPERLNRAMNMGDELDKAIRRLERRAEDRAKEQAGRREAPAGGVFQALGEVPAADVGGQAKGTRGERKASKSEAEAPRPAADAQINLTDGDSALMCKNRRSGFQQSYNAQATVDAEGSQLILSARVTNKTNGKQELAANVEAMDDRVGTPSHVLADNGYASEREVERLSSSGMEVLVAVRSGDRRRHWDFRPHGALKPDRPIKASWMRDMDGKMSRPENKKLYGLRKQTVEPVFGVMKHWMGCGRFLLRGKEKAGIEWDLMALAYSCKRMHNMMRACEGPAAPKSECARG